MKTLFRLTSAVVLLTSVGITVPAIAAMDHGHGMPHQGADAGSPSKPATSDGTVKKVDKAAGKITISHGPLEGLGMPAMTMVFRAAEREMLEEVKAGDKVRFTADRVEGVFVVTALEVIR